jgi:hypothetical protein
MVSNLKPGKHQPSRILVAVDGSDTSSMIATDYAIKFIKNNDNEPTVVFIY